MAKKTDLHLASTSALFDHTTCPICSRQSHTVVRASAYPENITEQDLLSLYSASSHSGLLDQVVRCTECDLVYLNPRPARRIIISSYQDAVDPVFVQQNPARIETFGRALRKLSKKYGISPRQHPRILDIGCAGGAFLKAATNAGYTPVGVEPSRWMVKYAQRELKVDARPGTLSEHSFPPASFDLISLWDVLEHLPEPAATLAEINRLLRPGGYLIVNYPDIGSIASRVMGWRWPFWLSVHLTYYTRLTVTRQLQSCGFDVIGIDPYFQNLELGYALERASVIFKPFGLLRSLTRMLGMGKLPVRYNMGQTLVIARKPQ